MFNCHSYDHIYLFGLLIANNGRNEEEACDRLANNNIKKASRCFNNNKKKDNVRSDQGSLIKLKNNSFIEPFTAKI